MLSATMQNGVRPRVMAKRLPVARAPDLDAVHECFVDVVDLAELQPDLAAAIRCCRQRESRAIPRAPVIIGMACFLPGARNGNRLPRVVVVVARRVAGIVTGTEAPWPRQANDAVADHESGCEVV